MWTVVEADQAKQLDELEHHLGARVNTGMQVPHPHDIPELSPTSLKSDMEVWAKAIEAS